MQWFCRAIKLCIISVKIDTAIMVKVTFEKVIFSLNKVKKVLLAAWVTFFVMQVKVGRIIICAHCKKELQICYCLKELWNYNQELILCQVKMSHADQNMYKFSYSVWKVRPVIVHYSFIVTCRIIRIFLKMPHKSWLFDHEWSKKSFFSNYFKKHSFQEYRTRQIIKK